MFAFYLFFIVPGALFLIVWLIRIYNQKQRDLINKQAEEIENKGFVGYEGAISLLESFEIKDAEILLKKWFFDNNVQRFRELASDIEDRMNLVEPFLLSFNYEDILSAAELRAFLAHVLMVYVKYDHILKQKYRQLVIKDDYGNLVLDDWKKERDYFFEKVLKKDRIYQHSLELYLHTFLYRKQWAWAKSINPNCDESELKMLVLKQVDEEIYFINRSLWDENIQFILSNAEDEDDFIEVDDTTSFEYEKFCECELIRGGWDAAVTKNGADQGVDIRATKNGFIIVVQCKKYNNSVGNKAVQEIISGREYYKADAAIVVTNAAFTKSAKQLASASNVKLLHHDQLRLLEPSDF